MPSNNDQFEHGRIPIRPLSYKNRDLSNTNELIIDYGEDASYHIYISHHTERGKYIDITALIVNEMLPKVEINGDQFTVTVEGEKNPRSLKDIINFIWKRFLYAEDPSGYVPEEDQYKLYLPTTVTVLLQASDGQIMLPVTLADNVFDKDGNTIQSRLDSQTKLGFGVSYIYSTRQDQTSFEFEYPFEDYPDMLELRIGTTYIDNTRYQVTKHYDAEGHYKTGTIDLLGESIEVGRRLDLVWIYNCIYDDDGSIKFMSGSKFADGSIPLCKMEKYSDSYSYPDGNSIATSKALANMYLEFCDMLNADNDHIFHCPDINKTQNVIEINIGRNGANGDVYFVTTSCDKASTATLKVGSNTYQVKYATGSKPTKGYRGGQSVKFTISNNEAIVLAGAGDGLRSTKYAYDCVDQETVIPFKNMDYHTGDLIQVYRNGVRLFEDIDYSMNLSNETITLFVRTELNERIVFEAIGM